MSENKNMTQRNPTAAMVAIGDEILSGRTRDANMHYLANWLTARGVNLIEVRVVPDVEDVIVAAVNDVRATADYVFTSGGIGPTHDDITALAIGKAFEAHTDVRYDALAILKEWYDARGEEITPARRRMARVPEGASLIANAVSGAPGFRIGNVFVMAGVPKIFQAMLEAVDDQIERGPSRISFTVRGNARESEIAEALAALQASHPDISIGSYPGKTGQGRNVAIVLRGYVREDVHAVALKVHEIMQQKEMRPELIEGMPVTDED
ncbi:competence/damage-inducible protein A [Aquisalinus flavus]|uniref:Molybdenum cofactor biosynthesis protein n=1 Tax=Aquisalinus flavus TaxID=1526572 RepID=A0A8J2V0X7_9PROT|nr:molybdopterin-binding protein [Aquisalinus flavus]MBD0426871.1 competence/damage-inducible protein A [Aquisalinus flavus]UNE46718.1 competence/damage-inducible protein A [Aquisalinus flavus]GGC96631.1 molybdenum cofactor biosynthesis protein [Aquisalinus flavus]